jgi:ABC-type microcin C transport system permease subunit YejB
MKEYVMKRVLSIATVVTLFTASAAFAQAAPGQASGDAMKSGASNSNSAGMQADTNAPKHKRMARHHAPKGETAMNASDAETTKQLNQDQAQYASTGSGAMVSNTSMGMSGSVQSSDAKATRPVGSGPTSGR